MSDTSLAAVVRHLRQIAPPSTDPRDDRELLESFAIRRDQAAFAVLVRRHGPLVLNVCRRVLHHEQDAEDAFQATFLVLMAKAGSLRAGASVPGFLHGVAYRLALKMRRDAMRRRRREEHASAPIASESTAEPSWREVQTVLEEEIQRLPDKYRLPFVLCHLEGLSRAEAGRQLGLKEGTVWSRLSQARARLQQRLSRRGIALTAVLAALAISARTVRAGLAQSVVQAAGRSTMAAASARVTALAQTGLQATAGKVKLALAGFVLLLAVGAGSMFGQALTTRPPETPAAPPPPAKVAAQPNKSAAAPIRTDRHGDPLPDGALARLGTVRWRHGFMVTALKYSPDGKKIAAVGGGRALTLWNAATGKELSRFPNINQPIGLAFSPDGKIIATTDNPYCYLWDVATGKEVRRLQGHQNVVRGVAFSPDGKLVATASADGTVRLWDPATGKELRRIDCGAGEVCRLAYSPDGKWIASTSMDGTIRLWDPATGKEERQLKGHEKAIWGIDFSPDGKRLATSSDDGTIRLWDVATGRELHIVARDVGNERAIAFSPDGTLLAIGCRDGTVQLWDVKEGDEKRRWQSGTMPVRAVAFSPDGKSLASVAPWESMRLWDVATGRERHPSDEHLGPVTYLRFSPDGATLTSMGNDRRVLRWDLATNTLQRPFSWTGQGLDAAALSPDGATLAAGGWPDFKVRLWDVRSGKPGRTLGKHEKRILTIAFSPDGRLVASGGEDHEIHVWDTRDGKEVRSFTGFTTVVTRLCFSPNSKALACGMMTQGNLRGEPALYLWEVASGKELVQFDHAEAPWGTPLAFSPDGKILASATGESKAALVQLWDTATGKEVCRHTGHREPVASICFSPDGKLVASAAGFLGTRDNSVHVWESATGRLIRRFEGHHSGVNSLAFSPDGLTLASGAGDSTILLWDITGRQQDGKLRRAILTPRELEACWTALADEDAAKAYDAVWNLVASANQSLPLLQKQLPPVPRPDATIVAQLLRELGSDDFKVRHQATKELSRFGDAIVPDLRRALDGKPVLEVRKRLRQLLEEARAWTPERLREHRAMQALEHIGTPKAKEVLEALAAGVSGAHQTEEAKEVLQRLKR